MNAEMIELFATCICKEQLDGARMTQLATQPDGPSTLGNMALRHTAIQDHDGRRRVHATAALILHKWRQDHHQ